MKYYLYAAGLPIGYSPLDREDESMGVRMGCFSPGENYARFQPLFRKYSSLTACDIIEFEKRKAEMESIAGEIKTLGLRVTTENGEEIGTTHILLTDHSLDLGDEGLELTVCVVDCETYERFFS